MRINLPAIFLSTAFAIFSLLSLKVMAQDPLKVQIFNQTTIETLPTNVFQRIEVDGKGHVWAGTNGLGLVMVNPQDNTASVAFPTHQVRAITRDSMGDIWFGSG